MAGRYDAIIVGGGHNGLVAAFYLAKAGRNVLVLERREMVGGCAVTEPLWPGYRVSSASYLVSLLQQKIVDDMQLERHGYRVDAKDPAFFSPFPDGRYFYTWQDSGKTLAEVAKFSKRDASRMPEFDEQLERLAKLVESLLLTCPPPFPPRGVGEIIEYLKLAGRLRGLSAKDLVALVKVFTMSAADYLDEWFESPEVKVTLATDGVIGANGGPRSPGTAYILLHHCMGGVGGKRGLWGFVRGGMGAVSEAMASAAKAAGAEIRCGAHVARLKVKDNVAMGVVLKNGDELDAKQVASNLDPARTFLRLLDPDVLPPEFAASIRNYRCEGISAKLNLGVKALPNFRALPGASMPHHKATMHICPSMDYVEKAWDDAKYGRPSERPMLELTCPTMYDPSLAPEGRHVIGVFLQYAPYTLKAGSWDDLRDPFFKRILKVIEEYAPGFSGAIEHAELLTPLDLEKRYSITGGNIFHGEMSLDQMFSLRPVARYANYGTPVTNLFLCGSGTHPGGGVMGAPGHNAAMAMLRR
ncbi:MAG TPA: NAD(P)/FAD-dependent oxidoreductase [Bryobacteraceae bacterium]|nr:NAD(P)/FAD-dependent oxidoreductase [Bryobacteraceae bacterium]